MDTCIFVDYLDLSYIWTNISITTPQSYEIWGVYFFVIPSVYPFVRSSVSPPRPFMEFTSKFYNKPV